MWPDYKILLIFLICLCIDYADSCCINLDNWNIIQQYINIFVWVSLFLRWEQKRGRGDIYHEIEFPRPKKHDIKIPRPKNRDIEFRGLKHHDIEKQRRLSHDHVIPKHFFQRTKSYEIVSESSRIWQTNS